MCLYTHVWVYTCVFVYVCLITHTIRYYLASDISTFYRLYRQHVKTKQKVLHIPFVGFWVKKVDYTSQLSDTEAKLGRCLTEVLTYKSKRNALSDEYWQVAYITIGITFLYLVTFEVYRVGNTDTEKDC